MEDLTFNFRKLDFSADIKAFRSLLKTYGELRGHDKALGDFASELAKLPGEYSIVFLAWSIDDKPVGCVATKDLGRGICEMKRLFVLPEFQGIGIGRALAVRIIIEASLYFEKMRLDTHPSMLRALKLYKSLGFHEISRYNDNPTPGIRFFELELHKKTGGY